VLAILNIIENTHKEKTNDTEREVIVQQVHFLSQNQSGLAFC